jgi:hypothetical protein
MTRGASRWLRPGLVACGLAIAFAFASCETTDDGYAGGGYYDAGLSDPWYYGGDAWYDDDIAVPPAERPMRPPRPEHPIARPPGTGLGGPRPMPMPSIPSRPRPSVRR